MLHFAIYWQKTKRRAAKRRSSLEKSISVVFRQWKTGNRDYFPPFACFNADVVSQYLAIIFGTSHSGSFPALRYPI